MARPTRSGISRRDFGKLATTAALGLGTLLAPPGRAEAKPEQAPPPVPGHPDHPQPPEPTPEARALGEIVRARYGDRLDQPALREIIRGIDGGLQGAAKLRKVALANADEPAFRFRAWRSDR